MHIERIHTERPSAERLLLIKEGQRLFFILQKCKLVERFFKQLSERQGNISNGFTWQGETERRWCCVSAADAPLNVCVGRSSALQAGAWTQAESWQHSRWTEAERRLGALKYWFGKVKAPAGHELSLDNTCRKMYVPASCAASESRAALGWFRLPHTHKPRLSFSHCGNFQIL